MNIGDTKTLKFEDDDNSFNLGINKLCSNFYAFIKYKKYTNYLTEEI